VNQPEELASEEATALPDATFFIEFQSQLRPLLVGLLLLTFLAGVAFPAVLFCLARPLFRHEANGSLLMQDNVIVGSELIGQNFSSPGYFHPRPSAAGSGYDPLASGGSNLGPANPKLCENVRAMAEAYRLTNGLRPDALIPIDAVTTSGSGLDPHISKENAACQLPRVARERGMDIAQVRELVDEHTRGRQLGFLGEPRVAVLALNLALDRAAPMRLAGASQ
jgi:K+-transporting ATPase ATPase C chain